MCIIILGIFEERVRKERAAFLVYLVVVSCAQQYYNDNFYKTPQHTLKLKGYEWIYKILDGNPHRLRNNLGVSRRGFLFLENELIKKAGLKETKFMTTTEIIRIFLYAVTSDLFIRKFAERFQRSTETIDKYYYKVIKCLLDPAIYRHYIKSLTRTTPRLPSRIADNPDYMPMLKGLVGAINGTYIDIVPPESEKAFWRDYGGNITQNVLVTVDFEIRFIDVMAG